ncbi:MAG: hypothetical protein AVO35_00080 [Candidatus Aegiribacteria sp. MLS_C]|nr:MAG: hypothetical protein AVO35_00080 [Candidatus Aegiribacteria sp. MLS_C]
MTRSGPAGAGCGHSGTDRLDSIVVSVFDCQTTGATPERGDLLELAWAVLTPGGEGPVPVHDFLVALPDGRRVPEKISRLTGINDGMLTGAIDPDELAELVGPVIENSIPVAHFSSFEERWLERLLSRVPGGCCSVNLLCTREIARRLLPGVPRKGIRALSGYFGHTLGECRRAGEHVLATVSIWRSLLGILETRGIITLGGLLSLLEEPVPKMEGGFVYRLSRETRLSLPASPGVYRFLSASGDLLYAGKATSLRRRVNSYFTRRKGAERTLELVTQIHDMEYDECATPLEAALLEFEIIDGSAPVYNVALRDRGAAVRFLSGELDRPSAEADEDHPRGPVLSGSPALLLPALRASIADGIPPAPADIGLDCSPPAPGALEEGFEAFAASLSPKGFPTAQDLLTAGSGLWESMKGEEGEPDAGGDDGGAEDGAGTLREPRREVMSADDVRKHMERLLAFGVRDLLRGSWYILLGWSGLVWRPGTGGRSRSLRFDCGFVRGAAWLEEGGLEECIAPALNEVPSRLERMRRMGGSSYRRIRVLDGEVRRLAAGGSLEGILIPGGRMMDLIGIRHLYTRL